MSELKFNLPKLDKLLGNISKGRVILIEGVGNLALKLALKFLKNAIDKGYQVFAIVPKRLRKDISREVNANVIVPNDNLTFHELFTISLIVKKLTENIGLIDIIQPLLIVHSPEKVYQLFQEICDIVRSRDGVLVVTIDKKFVDEKVLAMFEMEADFVIEIDEVVDKLKVIRGIRVKKSPVNPPSDFYRLYFDGDIEVGEKID